MHPQNQRDRLGHSLRELHRSPLEDIARPFMLMHVTDEESGDGEEDEDRDSEPTGSGSGARGRHNRKSQHRGDARAAAYMDARNGKGSETTGVPKARKGKAKGKKPKVKESADTKTGGKSAAAASGSESK